VTTPAERNRPALSRAQFAPVAVLDSCGFTPAAGSQPVHPPLLCGLVFFAPFSRQFGSRWGNASERLKPYRGPQFMDVLGIRKCPTTRNAVARIIYALSPKTPWPAFLKRATVFEVGGMPSGNSSLFNAGAQQFQRLTHEFRLANRMRCDQPGRFCAIGPGNVFPSLFEDQFSPSDRIVDVHSLHARMKFTPEFVRSHEFLAHPQIFRSECQQLAATSFVDHGKGVAPAHPLRQNSGSHDSPQAGTLEEARKGRSNLAKPGEKGVARGKLDPKILIFDVDGVLVNVRETYWRSGLETMQALTGRRPTWAEFREWKRKPGNNDDWMMVSRWATELGVPTTYEQARQAFSPFYWGSNGQPGNVLKEKLLVTPKLIERWAGRRELNLFTGRTRQEFSYTFDKWPAARSFRTVITMDDAKKKPDPEGLRIILARRDPQTALYLGDNIDDALAAKAARVPFMAILSRKEFDYRQRAKGFRELGALALLEHARDLDRRMV
jgi:HAD superfamily phosphatase